MGAAERWTRAAAAADLARDAMRGYQAITSVLGACHFAGMPELNRATLKAAQHHLLNVAADADLYAKRERDLAGWETTP